jgi:hypothetical protein
LICDLDLDDLHQSRGGGTVMPRVDRRTDLFQLVSNLSVKPENPVDGPLGDQPAMSTGRPDGAPD